MNQYQVTPVQMTIVRATVVLVLETKDFLDQNIFLFILLDSLSSPATPSISQTVLTGILDTPCRSGRGRVHPQLASCPGVLLDRFSGSISLHSTG